MSFDFVTLGETMVRLVPPGALRLEQAQRLHLSAGGTESTVAVNLARLGKKVAWVSRLPTNPMGRYIANQIRQHGVDLSGVTWTEGERQATYYVEYGVAPRSIRVWYDRANSAASRMTPNDLPIELIQSARWLHLTGITPALSASCHEAVQRAFDIARAAGITCSFDVNYRSLLWSPEEAGRALEPFCELADYVLVAGRDAHSLFGAAADVKQAAQDLQARWEGTLIVTNGDAGVVATDGENFVSADAYPATIVDRLGAGDALASGIICRLLEGAPLEVALRFGTAMAALSLTVDGDFAWVTRDEIEAVLNRGESRLRR